MESISSVSESTEDQSNTKTTWIDIIFIILLINVGIVILVSILAIVFNSDYLENLLLIGVISGAVFVVVIVAVFLLSLGLPAIIRRIFHWDEEREVNLVVNLLFILSFLFVIVAAIGLYIIALPFFPVVADPFNLAAINPLLATVYSIWWFFGFIVSILVITILYMLLETGRYT